MKLIAKTTIKHGVNGETAQPGESFDFDDKKFPESAKQLVESGDAELATSAKPEK